LTVQQLAMVQSQRQLEMVRRKQEEVRQEAQLQERLRNLPSGVQVKPTGLSSAAESRRVPVYEEIVDDGDVEERGSVEDVESDYSEDPEEVSNDHDTSGEIIDDNADHPVQMSKDDVSDEDDDIEEIDGEGGDEPKVNASSELSPDQDSAVDNNEAVKELVDELSEEDESSVDNVESSDIEPSQVPVTEEVATKPAAEPSDPEPVECDEESQKPVSDNAGDDEATEATAPVESVEEPEICDNAEGPSAEEVAVTESSEVVEN